jgi:uncharacterized repeat protein (TIGR01451 family)
MHKQKQKKISLVALFSKLHKAHKLYICGLIILSIAIGLSFYLSFSNKNTASAASIAYANGQVSLDKKYFQNNNEVTSLSTIPNGEVTVRVKYNNSGDQAALNSLITDTIPNNFSFVTGSLKNCYVDIACVGLNDSLINSGILSASPGAGYFGNLSNSGSVMDLEMGKKSYLQLVECVESSTNSTVNTFNINSSVRFANTTATNLPAITPNCASSQTISFSYVQTLALTGNKYLHFVECLETFPGSDTSSFNINSSNRTTNISTSNTSTLTPSCTSNQVVNSPNIKTLQTFGNRYLHIVECFETSIAGDVNTFNINSPSLTANTTSNNDPTLIPECTSVNNNITESAVQTFDMLDTSRGYGFMEYKIKASSTATGQYGTNVTLTGNFGTITATAEKTIDIIGCNTRYPANWQINLSLTDAELRSDQDFTCNYIPKICPVVFNDLNNDGIQSSNETNIVGQTINLYREDGVTLVTTLVTDLAGAVCFDNIAGGGTIYKVANLNPITQINSTGGNIKTVNIGSNSATTSVKFGYSSGALSLAVPPSVTFPSSVTSSASQTKCTEVNPIEITDTRGNQPGWSVTGVVDNFADIGNTKTLFVANNFRSEPGSLTIVTGLPGPQLGANKTITSTTDPFSVISVGSSAGQGVYRLSQSICQTLAPYTPAGDYKTVITYTII